ncbi:MAG: HAMP domain-containing histidine kinase [Rhodocyclales bacterium]|nr:HAMP domain-containing histidine kinase [Rhodocyclales bacterium]
MKTLLAWLASFRLRILLRTSFLLLGLTVLAMTVTVLQEEKQRSYDNYRASLAKTREQIVARLHHPAGQLALLNPGWNLASAARGRPVVLPYSALDFDDQSKVRSAIEMSGCLVHFPDQGSLCVAIGNNPWAGGFIYAAGAFTSETLQAHRIGDEFLDNAHRLRVQVSLRGQSWSWIAPFEPLPAASGRNEGLRGRFTGYNELPGRDYTGTRPLREFRGWVWQNAECAADFGPNFAVDRENCPKRAFFSLRLPIEALREALFQREKPTWPPPDLDQFQVRIELLPPGDGPAIFDSQRQDGIAPFALDQLASLLLPGESLRIRQLESKKEIAHITGRDEAQDVSSPLLTRLIRKLPVENIATPEVELKENISTALGSYELELRGDARSVNKTLSVVATRLSWFVGAMLGAIALAWLVIEIGLIRRIARLTKRTRGLAQSVHADGGLERYQLADLRGSDELGLFASALNELLRRVREDAGREKIRAEQEKDMWHAVGHEIMSPLQSLLALHGSEDDPSHRYISRMQQAVRVLYGSASPSEAFERSQIETFAVDLAEFVKTVAENVGIEGVVAQGCEQAVLVRADEYPLEDVFAHLLKNAERYRHPGTPITLSLSYDEHSATVTLHNQGPQIPEELLEKIFEYGVSDQPESAAAGNRGQGLFVAKTYMAKMGGTITARNEADGVTFVLGLGRVG